MYLSELKNGGEAMYCGQKNSKRYPLSSEHYAAYAADPSTQFRWRAEPGACDRCLELHGAVFSYCEVPERPHLNCKCQVEYVVVGVVDMRRSRSKLLDSIDRGLKNYGSSNVHELRRADAEDGSEKIIDYKSGSIGAHDASNTLLVQGGSKIQVDLENMNFLGVMIEISVFVHGSPAGVRRFIMLPYEKRTVDFQSATYYRQIAEWKVVVSSQSDIRIVFVSATGLYP